MSLDFDMRTMDESVKNEADWPVTESLIWATMGVGIREITDANAEEFHTRLSIWHQVLGTRPQWGDRITLADVRKRIGLRTNASTLTKAQFKKRAWDLLWDDATRQTMRDRHKAEKLEADHAEALTMNAFMGLKDATRLNLVDVPVTAEWPIQDSCPWPMVRRGDQAAEVPFYTGGPRVRA